LAMLDRAVGLYEHWGIANFFAQAAPPFAYARALSGRALEAIPLVERAVEQAASMQYGGEQSTRVTYLGEVYYLAGRVDDARAAAERALALAQEHGERGYEAWAWRLRGEIAAHADPCPVDQAESYYRQALALSEELGMRPLVAHCHLGLGSLYQRG